MITSAGEKRSGSQIEHCGTSVRLESSQETKQTCLVGLIRFVAVEPVL